MERIVISERGDFTRALDCLREHCIEHNPDSTGVPVIRLHDNADVESATIVLRAHGIKAVHKPWD